MTVKELINKLQELTDQDMIVYSYDHSATGTWEANIEVQRPYYSKDKDILLISGWLPE